MNILQSYIFCYRQKATLSQESISYINIVYIKNLRIFLRNYRNNNKYLFIIRLLLITKFNIDE